MNNVQNQLTLTVNVPVASHEMRLRFSYFSVEWNEILHIMFRKLTQKENTKEKILY